MPEVLTRPGAEIGIISVGSCDGAVREAVDGLAERGISADYMRVRAFPFHESVGRFLEAYPHLFVVEQNRDGQLRSLLTLETGAPQERLFSVRYYGGLALSAHHVIEGVLAELEPGASGTLGTAVDGETQEEESEDEAGGAAETKRHEVKAGS